MRDLEKKTGDPILMDNDYEAFRKYLSGLM
jgi:hypothetical protein